MLISSKFLTNSLIRPVSRLFSQSYFPKGRLTSISEAKALVGKPDIKFLDIRDPIEYEKSHIPGSVNIKEIFTFLAKSDKAGVQELTNLFQGIFQNAGVTGKEHIITYEDCLKTRFGASCRGYYLLKLFQHPSVSVLNGGWEAWVQDNGQVDNKATNPKKGDFVCGWDKSLWSGRDEILEIVTKKDPNTVLLDVRDFDEWKGESSSPYGVDFVPRKGRLEGAVHVLWKDFMSVENGITYLKKDKIEEVCKSKGITKDKKVVVYCFKGARASNTLIALKETGFENVTNYFGSWNEWARDSSLPIDDRKI